MQHFDEQTSGTPSLKTPEAEQPNVTPTLAPAPEAAASTALVEQVLGTPDEKEPGRLAQFWRALTANRKVMVGLSIIGFFVLVALVGPFLLGPHAQDFSNDLLQPPSAQHLFGTTDKGEDLFAQ